jgi:hypothetical protein
MNFIDIFDRLKVLRGPRGLGEPGKNDTIPLNILKVSTNLTLW